jgi:GTPase Era involved in 16S rRNA processing
MQAIDIQQIDRSGQVAVLGVPNSGKSSLVNELVGMKAWVILGLDHHCPR